MVFASFYKKLYEFVSFYKQLYEFIWFLHHSAKKHTNSHCFCIILQKTNKPYEFVWFLHHSAKNNTNSYGFCIMFVENHINSNCFCVYNDYDEGEDDLINTLTMTAIRMRVVIDLMVLLLVIIMAVICRRRLWQCWCSAHERALIMTRATIVLVMMRCIKRACP